MGGVTESRLSLDRIQSPPAQLRAWSVVIVALIAITGSLSALAALRMSSATDTIDNSTGALLTGSQELIASLAEADAANTSVFLAGGSEADRQRRLVYETAVERSARQLERLAARTPIENAADHERLEGLSADLVGYVSDVEQTLADPDTRALRTLIDDVGGETGMIAEAAQVSTAADAQLDDDIAAGETLTLIALVASVAALLALGVAQLRLANRTQRRINPGLLAATLVMVGLAAWLTIAAFGRLSDLNAARADGYESIAASAELQIEGFGYKTLDAANQLSARDFDPSERLELADSVRARIATLGDLADSERERAAVDSVATRWERFVDSGGDNTAFNGFTTSLEAVLLGNRDQFEAGVDSASARLEWLFLGSIVLALAAAGATLAGYQPRINEYF